MLTVLDVGGSSIKSGGFLDGRPDGVTIATPVDHRADIDDLIGRFAGAIDSHPSADRIAIAVPDPFDHHIGISWMEHKFVALRGLPLEPLIRARAGTTASIRWCNDAAAAVTGEALAGAGADVERVLGVTLGTGLGAAFVVGGRPVGEVGGVVASRLYERRLPSGESADDVFSGRGYMARLRDVGDDISAGEQFGEQFARFLRPIVGALDAEVIVVGGGGAASFDRFAPSLRTGLPVPVASARLGAWAPLIGAAHICFG